MRDHLLIMDIGPASSPAWQGLNGYNGGWSAGPGTVSTDRADPIPSELHRSGPTFRCKACSVKDFTSHQRDQHARHESYASVWCLYGLKMPLYPFRDLVKTDATLILTLQWCVFLGSNWKKLVAHHLRQ